MALDPDELVDLAVFARVVEKQSFSAAAKDLRVVKSVVSRRIAALEDRLGVQLLRRTSRRLELTPDGSEFAGHVARMLDSARAARDAVATSGRTLRGSIRVSAPVTFSQMYLARVIATFQVAHPEVQVELVTDDRFVDVVGGGFDLVVRIGALSDASFVAKRIATDRLVVVGAPAYFARVGRPESPAALAGHNCLRYALSRHELEWRFRGAVAPARGNFSTNDGTVLREAAVTGQGLAVLPYFMVASDVASGRLEIVLEGARKAELGIHAVLAAARGQPLRVRALVEHLRGAFGARDWQKRAATR